MSIRKKLGQLIMMDFRFWGNDSNGEALPFTKANSDICKLFANYNFGGFILFRENIESNEQTIKLLRDLQNCVDIPLFFGIDQEGGRVNRLKQGTSTCGNMAVGANGNPKNAKLLAEIIGAELYSLGININFAPTVDVNTNPNNPIIGVRSFSENPQTVIDFAKESIKGYHETNIIPCVKHFPGHGNTALDTHAGNVTIDRNLAELEKEELYPFAQLCKNSQDLVMTAHISVPTLDDTTYKSKATGEDIYLPSSLSYKITTELLKEQMQFKGLVFTDAMDMRAISSNFGQIEATKMTILAGTDVAVMPIRIWSKDDIYKLEELFTELENEYKSNPTFAKRVDEAYQNIINFKKTKNLDKSYIYTKTFTEQLGIANNIVACQKHKDTELEIAKQSTTIAQDNGLIPYSIENKSILIIDSDNARLEAFAKYTQQIATSKNYDTKIITRNISQDASNDIAKADLVLIVSESLREYNKQYSHINALAKDKSINIAALTPYDIKYMDNVENYVCIYGATSMDQTNYKKTTLEINILAGLMNIFI